MNVLGWVLSGLLATVFALVGLGKLVTAREALRARPHMEWVDDFSQAQVRGIGTVEVLGAVGVTLPWLTGVAPVLTPIAALGLAVVMALAMVVHARRGETGARTVNLSLMALALVVAALRFAAL